MRLPNVIMILADDMGYGDFERFNPGVSRTPALERLMDEGMTFSQHYAASPVCAPARAAILTGRYPQRSGVIDTLEARGTDRLGLSETTIADELGAAGYRTGLVGKWHNGAIDPRYSPLARGFDEFTGFRGGWSDYWDWQLERNGSTVRADGRYLTDALTDYAVEFVERNSAGPFFLHLAYNAPHFPFQAHEADVERFRDGERSETVATIYAMIEAMDAGIGRLLESLDDLGLANDTIVMFSSDNGPQLDRVLPGAAGEADRFNLGLRGEKLTVWEGGIRVPLVVRWPDHIEAGTSSDAFIHASDWLPTLMDLTGVRRRALAPLDGRSVAAGITGGSALEDGVERFWHWTRYEPDPRSNAAIRVGALKLVMPAITQTLEVHPLDQARDQEIKVNPERFVDIGNTRIPRQPAFEPPAPMLFDLSVDPEERNDLADQRPTTVANMSARLASWFEGVERERREAHKATARGPWRGAGTQYKG